jgi:hypothetical protein
MRISALYSWARIDGDRNLALRSGSGGARATLNTERMEYSTGSSAAFESAADAGRLSDVGRGVVLPVVLRLLAIEDA